MLYACVVIICVRGEYYHMLSFYDCFHLFVCWYIGGIEILPVSRVDGNVAYV